MKKLTFVIGIFVILWLAFLSVECIQRRQPSFIAINHAISWAKPLVGEASFPVVSGGKSVSQNMCAEFVAVAYGADTSYDAYTYWTWSNLIQHPKDWNAPRGSLVFFDRSPTSGVGHVALSMGNGKLIQAGYPTIMINTIRDEAENPESYLGWAWPPPNWPGRSNGSAVADFLMNMDTFIKSSINSALVKLHIY